MQALFTTLISGGVFSAAGWVIAGVIAILGYFDRQRKNQRQDDDSVASNLINNLKTTTEVQEKELTSLRGKEIEQGKEIAHLQGQVKILSEILQGRDPQTKDILAQIPEIVKIGMHNGESIEKLTTTMVQFMEKLTKVIN